MNEADDCGASNPQRPLLIRMAIAICVFAVGTVFVLSAVLFVQAERSIRRRVHAEELRGLKQLSLGAEFLIDATRSIALQARMDFRLDKRLAFPNADPAAIRSVLYRLEKYRLTASEIHSIFVYDARIDGFYVSSGLRSCCIGSGDPFYEVERHAVETYGRVSAGSLPVRRRLHEPELRNNLLHFPTVYSFFFPFSPVPTSVRDGAPDSCVVINVQEHWIRTLVDTLNGVCDALFLASPAGDVLSIIGDTEGARALAERLRVENRLEPNRPAGGFVLGSGGEKVLVVVAQPTYADWAIVKTVPYSVVTAAVSGLRVTSMVAVLVVLAIAVTAAVVLAMKLYRPFDAIIDRVHDLEDRERDSYQVLRQRTLRRLVLESGTRPEVYDQLMLNDFGIRIGLRGVYRMLLIALDGWKAYALRNPPRRRDADRTALLAHLGFAKGAPYALEQVDLEEGRIALVIYGSRPSCLPGNERLQRICADLQGEVRRIYGSSCSVAVSRAAVSIRALPDLYADCSDAVRSRYILGPGAILRCDDGVCQGAGGFTYPVKQEKELIRALMLGDADRMKARFDGIVDAAAQVSYGALRMSETYLAYAVNRGIESLAKGITLDFQHEYYGFLSALEESEYLSATREMFYTLFDRIQHSVDRHKRRKTRRIVEGVAEVISTHAFEPTFGAPEIADALGMSAAYVGRVYKQATGRSIPEAVNEVRMQRARELLLETTKTVGEIAEEVGYANTPYFYRQFRLRHGITPADFRRHSRTESAHAL